MTNDRIIEEAGARIYVAASGLREAAGELRSGRFTACQDLLDNASSFIEEAKDLIFEMALTEGDDE